MKTLLGLAGALTACAALAAPAPAQSVGSPPPELNATKWYNTPPLTLEDLKGKVVLLQVFRTW